LGHPVEDIYAERQWMSHMERDAIHKKIVQTTDHLIDADFLDREEALYSAVEKRKFFRASFRKTTTSFKKNENE
jgi:hypothetical protein